ncbi:hypothetical protein [Burkholderia gladioli]|uniref:hypothetical protein n=2 Tax=Burkholderia gladioli TaxID=28095 RepID=UPI00163EDED3|nr:hypothetical protein [Burkholderia gladioli]MBU9174652.1 hypothetical protein [Burkholderia gladioli]
MLHRIRTNERARGRYAMKKTWWCVATLAAILLAWGWTYRQQAAEASAKSIHVNIPADDGSRQTFTIAGDLEPIVNTGFFAINRPIPRLEFSSATTCPPGDHLVVMGVPRGPDQAQQAATGAYRLADQDGFRLYADSAASVSTPIRYRVFDDAFGDTVSVRDAGAWSANYEFEHVVAGRYLFRFLVRKTCGADFREFDRRAARFVDAMIEK